MNAEADKLRRLEALLAGLLHYGSWVASGVIALGLALALIDWRAAAQLPANAPGMRVVTAGIALFILLPVLRVILMLIVFVRERDYRFVAISALVLVILLMGFALGMVMKAPAPG
jgi:hypothetical protein